MFEDEACTVEIPDLNAWKTEGGRGYLPELEPQPTPTPTPTPSPIVKTGDSSMIGLWLMILAVCGLGLTAGTIYSKKKKQS